MDFLEKDLEQIIFETDNKEITKRGLFITGKKFTQIPLGNYGRLDLVTISRHVGWESQPATVMITIYEFKKDCVDVSAFLQVLKYFKGIERWFNQKDRFSDCIIEFKVVLVGKSVVLNNSLVYITDLCEDICFYTYSYEFDGIRFKKHSDYHLENEGF